MSSAPHLPDKEEGETTSNLRWFLLVVLLSALAGTASALATEAWLTPNINNSSTNRISIQNSTEQEETLSSLTKEQVEQRTVKVYDKREKIQNKYYKDSFLFKAVLLSSDGWAVTYQPGYVPGSYNNFEALDNQGVVHEVETAIYDDKSRLLYLNLEGENFRVTSIGNWNQIRSKQPVWVYGDNWNKEILPQKQKVSSRDVISLTEPIYSYSFAKNFKEGSLIVNQKGKLIGFSGTENNIVPAWYISTQINNVLSEQPLNYEFPEIKGIIIERKLSEKNRTESVEGVYVTQSESREIQSGDIITKINGKKVEKQKLTRLILTAEEPISISILTDKGQTKTINLNKNN